MKIIKIILKKLLLVILAIALALAIIFLTGIILDHLYKKAYGTKGVFIIVNNSFQYLINFIIIFIITMISFFKDNILRRPTDQVLTKAFKGASLLGILIIMSLFYLNYTNINILYEDRFISYRTFKDKQEYRIEDVETFTIGMEGSKKYKGLKMELNMEDGKSLNLFGSSEFTSDEFAKQYNTYGYHLELNNRLLELGIGKHISDKENILKAIDHYDEPYKTYIRKLLDEKNYK